MAGITTTGSIPQYIATATVPALTTIFTPPASFSCNNRYVAAESPNIAWSTYSRDGYSPPVDPIYYSCLPERLRGPHYSPGVCTDGQTIASMTKFEDGSRTMWQAQCCKSGLTLRMQTVNKSPIPMCVSVISTPLPVRALFTTRFDNGNTGSFYEQIINDQSTLSNMTTMTRGTAIADPLYVAWEAKDLSLFPVAYATSLASQISVDFTPTATPASGVSSGGPSQTGSGSGNGSSDSGLSSGTKIGIGVGVGVGAALVFALVAMGIVIRRLRNRNKAEAAYPNESTPAMHSELHGDGVTGAGMVKGKWYQRAQPGQGIEMNQGHNSGPNELDSMPVSYVSGPPIELEGSSVPGHGHGGAARY
ncbi:hypothetical protein DE146DRAFT_526087 [Phaeosphaeria sp. MPI-PUGE-AT-0046c]|nr:hypothetical protein DE146DRAFT_526087 [Phaeosphaeria sp. MPI-PUGE-AT-0046c]